MKKILDQLELHVQWLALLLGIVFVLYMAYAYLLMPPVKVEIAGSQLSPGEVDDFIWDKVGNELDRQTKQNAIPKMESPNLLSLFNDEINYGKKPLLDSTLVYAFPSNKEEPADPTKTDSKTPDGVAQGTKPGVTPQGLVTALPTLLAAKINGFRSGMSNITPLPDPAAAPGTPLTPVDKTWVTVRGEIDINAIVQAFNDVKIPMGTPAGKTSFIQLSMDREEKLADGSWGNHTTVPHIKTSEVQTMPLATAVAGDKWSYLQWAEAHTVDIMQPAFYPVIKGDPWAVPGEAVVPIANNQPDAAAFNPSQFLDATPAQIEAAHLTLDQKRLISAAKAAKAREAAKGRGPSRSSGPPRGGPPEGGPPGGAQRAPQDMGRPPGYGRMPTPMGPMGDAGEEMPEGMGPGGQQAASVNFPMPTGGFDPSEWLKTNAAKPTITVWSHDETAVPGHTYRYRLTYTIKNPIFFAVKVAKNPDLERIFSIPAPASGWTDDVEIIPTVNFWIARSPRTSGGAVDMQVFRWQSGTTVSKQFTVNPGDVIGQPDPTTDFTTGWTLVDVMTDPRTQEQYVLVIDPNGVIHKRDFRTDSADPKQKSWRDQASVAVAPAASPSPTR